jgi:hypothetical protein
VRSGVRKVLSLENNLRTARMSGESWSLGERGSATDKVVQKVIQLRVEGRVCHCRVVSGFKFLKRWYKRLRHIPTAESTKATAGIRNGRCVVQSAHGMDNRSRRNDQCAWIINNGRS